MNLFRSEEHVKRWPLYYRAVDDYIMSVADWATVFSSSMFRNRLAPDFLARGDEYLEDYRRSLKAMGKAIPEPDRVLCTVLFTDIVDSTKRAATVGDDAWQSLLERHDLLVRDQLAQFGGREVKHTGDGFLASFDSPARAIRCAHAICSGVRDIGLRVRAGAHVGECEVREADLGGIAVHIGARLGALAGPGEVLVSGTAKDAVAGSGIDFETRGVRELKGVPGEWEVFASFV
jgi:class 3 adenylate cyclase